MQNRADFIVIGAMKCATSTVRSYLANHPGVFMVRSEPDFFSKNTSFARGVRWYDSHFPKNANKCGEASNSYAELSRYPETVERMRQYNPALKIIYMVRHPIERMMSAWVQYRSDSAEFVSATPDLAVMEKPELFLETSRYWKTVSQYREAFSEAQIFVGFVEDLKRDSYDFFARLENFLGIYSETDIAYDRRANPSTRKKVLTPLYSRLRQLPFAKAATRVLPKSIKDRMKGVLTKPIPDRLDFLPATKRYLSGAVREDAETFLRHYRKSSDFWKFDYGLQVVGPDCDA